MPDIIESYQNNLFYDIYDKLHGFRVFYFKNRLIDPKTANYSEMERSRMFFWSKIHKSSTI